MAAGMSSDLSGAETMLESGVEKQIWNWKCESSYGEMLSNPFMGEENTHDPQNSQKTNLLSFNLASLLLDAEKRVNWFLV